LHHADQERPAPGSAHQHARLPRLQRGAVRDVRRPREVPHPAGRVPEQDHLLQFVLPPDRQRTSPLGVRGGLGRGGGHRRVLLLLAGREEVRPWLSRWWVWTTCTWCAACTGPAWARGRTRPRGGAL